MTYRLVEERTFGSAAERNEYLAESFPDLEPTNSSGVFKITGGYVHVLGLVVTVWQNKEVA